MLNIHFWIRNWFRLPLPSPHSPSFVFNLWLTKHPSMLLYVCMQGHTQELFRRERLQFFSFQGGWASVGAWTPIEKMNFSDPEGRGLIPNTPPLSTPLHVYMCILLSQGLSVSYDNKRPEEQWAGIRIIDLETIIIIFLSLTI